MKHLRTSNGFALPIVMLICLSLLISATSMLQVSSSLRMSIDDQYYARLAEEAAQSGVTYAISCLSQNAYTQTWTGDLTQTNDCDGTALATPLSTIVAQADTVGTFAVGDIEGRPDGAVLVTSTGTVKRMVNGSSTVAKTYTKVVKRIANSAFIKFKGVTFGYYFYGFDSNGAPYYSDASGVYYAVMGSDGRLRTAGSNDYGQLGNGTTSNVRTPTVVNLPGGAKAAETYTNFLSQGWNMFIRSTDGDIYGMGLNYYGQLGTGTAAYQVKTPQRFILPDTAKGPQKGTYVGLLGKSTYVITDQHNIYAAGECYRGELGTGGYTPNDECGGRGPMLTPERVALPTPTADPNTIPAEEIVADYASVYVRMEGGKVYGWGNNEQGQLCDGTYNGTSTPIQIGEFGNPGKPKAKQIAFDGITFFVLDDNGDAWGCGDNSYGQLGLSSGTTSFNRLQKIPIPPSAGTVKQISTDQWYAVFRTSKWQVWGAGYNEAGQLGNSTQSVRQSSLVQFELPNNVRAVKLYETSTGNNANGENNNLFVIGSDGRVYGAGGNTYGQLGNGSTARYVSKPTVMKVFNGRSLRAIDVTTGLGTTLILSSKNTYYTVGNNKYGQLGDGTTTNTSTPIEAKFLQTASGSFIF